MCGVAGYVGTDAVHCEYALERAERVQSHRGPDGRDRKVHHMGDWCVGLAHQRLAVIDLSPAGRQPMSVCDGRHWIIFNGEVYNYLEVRRELESLGIAFEGHSDTEVVLRAFAQWGTDALSKFNGMWALAWLDLVTRRLVLCRDRLGVKPLYMTVREGAIYFASEIKAILEMCGATHRLNYDVVGEYVFQSLLDTSDKTFFEGIDKIPPGAVLEIDLAQPEMRMRSFTYWTLAAVESPQSLGRAVESIRDTLIDAVRLRLRSDVPLGVLLSGGLDSSAIAACMQSVLGRGANLNVLSAVSDGGKFDETPFIDRMSTHLGLAPHKVQLAIDSGRALELLKEVCWYNDEPVGGFSNVAHFLLMKRAKELGITVILSGQGADELFCGYKKFVGFYVHELLRQRRWIAAGRTLLDYLRRGTVLNQFSIDEAKRYLPAFLAPTPPPVGGAALLGYSRQPMEFGSVKDVRSRQVLDLQRFSVPILTHYEDRMSMAWGREVRTPFLDYRLVEAAIALPTNLKLARGWTKYVLRLAMEPMLPKSIAWRKDKQSFVNPQGEWLKRDLVGAIEEVFGEESLIFRLGIFSRPALQNLYARYRAQPIGRGVVSFKEIFQPLALEVWLRNYERYLTV